MSDRIEVSNLSLNKLGEDDQLTDIDDDTKPARTIKAVWDTVRDAVLRDHFWNFAMTRGVLTAEGDKPEWGFDYQFPLPPDFLRLDIRRMEPSQVSQNFSLEGAQRLLCDFIGPVKILYVRRVKTVGDWDPLFVEAFATRLAAQCCIRLTGSKPLRKELIAEYKLALSRAKMVDGQENLPEDPMESSFVTARYDGGSRGNSNGYPTRFW